MDTDADRRRDLLVPPDNEPLEPGEAPGRQGTANLPDDGPDASTALGDGIGPAQRPPRQDTTTPQEGL